MTIHTIRNTETFIEFTYEFNIDSLSTNNQRCFNVITIEDYSTDLFEHIDIINGDIIIKNFLENDIHFPMLFETESFEHSFSVQGQFIWTLTKLLEQIQDC